MRRLLLAVSLVVPGLLWWGTLSAREGLDEYYQLGRGQQLYTRYCRLCHGEQGKGSAYALATPPPVDLTAPGVQEKTDAELLSTIHNGSPGTDMAAWNWALSEEEKRDVVAYIRSLGQP